MTSISKPPRSELGLRQQLGQAMQQCRQLTLQLFAHVDYETFCQQAHPDFSPIGWHLGHIAYTEALWLLEHCAQMPPQFPHYRRLFAADGLPKADRGALPDYKEVKSYLDTVRANVFDYLEVAPLSEQERLWRWLLQHESQHCETIAIVLNLLNQSPPLSCLDEEDRSPVLPTEMVCIPAGAFDCGNSSIVALDNERPIHRVELGTYWIDRYPVTIAQFRAFIAAGGYQTAEWWSPQGWTWLQSAQATQPLNWTHDPRFDQHPVSGISWYEADAYARFVGKRLPTEYEWEKAASWNSIAQAAQTYPWGESDPSPAVCNHNHDLGQTTEVTRYPKGISPSGCWDMLGNVWEWTATWFDGYPGFEPYPYRGYSQVYFDGQHRVLRGGSWATRSWALRFAFRNWYHPHVREVFAGFRCAAD